MTSKKAVSKKRTQPVVESRRALGRARPDGLAMFPVAPPKSELPSGYGDALIELKYMRAFAAAWPERTIVQEPLARISCYHHIALLLCRGKYELVVEYALRHLKRPVGVAEWETELVAKLPKALRGSLPTVEEIEAELGMTVAPRKKIPARAKRKPSQGAARERAS